MSGPNLPGILSAYDASGALPRFVTGAKGADDFLQQTLTYGPAIAWEYASGDMGIITITDAVAFVLGAPTLNGTAFGTLSSSLRTALGGAVLRVTYRNTSGGAHGAGTFNAAFKTSGGFTAVATGFNRSLEFVWNGTNWIEQFRTAADVAN